MRSDEALDPEQDEHTRAGMVAVVGAANAGKSSLINRLTGEKVSIVSPVAQTTRNLVRAILTEDGSQVVFLDTPGVHSGGGKKLNQQMNKMARTSTEGVDRVMLVIDRSRTPAMEVEGWMNRLAREREIGLLFVLNKCDLEDRAEAELRQLWERAAAEKDCPLTPEWRQVSAETGEGLEELKQDLLESMPTGPYLFPEELISDFPRKLAIGDIIREQYFHRLRQELPHSIAVWIEHLEEKDGTWKIEAHVYVRQNSQKGMVIGNKGRVLKAVRGAAATEIHQTFDVRVNLTLVVKVIKDWDKNFFILRKLGYA